MAKKLTTETFIQRAREVHGDRYDYSKVNYINSTTPVKIICLEHGEFEQRPSKHLSGHNCPKCSKHYRRNTKEFIEEASVLHNNKYDYSKVNFVDTHTKVCIICPEHGEFWQTPHMHLQGKGCPKCGGTAKLTTEEFIQKAREIHGDKYDYTKTKYINNSEKVCIICLKHGEFWQKANDHLSGKKGCPKCKLKSQTKLYEKLKESFPNEEMLYEVGNSKLDWIDGQRFDIYFPKYNISVEYNGIQHYVPVEHFGGKLGFENTLKRDELKRKKCKENNCILFEVKYDYIEEDYQKLVENIQNIINNYDRSEEN